MSRISINLADTTRLPPFVANILFASIIPNRIVIETDNGVGDGDALVLETDEERGRAILDVMRMKDRTEKRYATRGYVEGSRGGWSKIPVLAS